MQADHSERESSVNSMAFADHGEAQGGAHFLATGGEDGCLRVWELSAAPNGGAAGRHGSAGGVSPERCPSGVSRWAGLVAKYADNFTSRLQGYDPVDCDVQRGRWMPWGDSRLSLTPAVRVG